MQSYCYRCKFWKRCEDDFIVGLCRIANAYRFQFEDCEMFELIEGYSPLFDDAENISLKKNRNETIVSLYKEGVGVKKIAYDFGLTPDYVKRMIRRMV